MSFQQINICSKILKDHVVKKALNEAEAKAFYQKKNPSPSMDFMCARKAYYNLAYSGGSHLPIDPKDVTYENERAKVIGNNFHEYIQKQFEDAGVLLLNETTFADTDNKIRARLDCVIEANNEPILVELKSAKSYSMHLFNSDGSPDMEHIKQIQLYFHLLDLNKDEPEIASALKGRTVNRGIILYESKNDHKIMEFMVNRDEALIRELLRYSKYVWKCFDKKEVPKQKFEPDSSECMYKCSTAFYNMCHGKPKPVKDPGEVNVWGAANVKETNKDPKFR
jgi:hypothetical protein